jgi:diaminopimelate decarboxylase
LVSGDWPHSARYEPDGEISVAGMRLSVLAAAYGTPAFILDEAEVRYRCRNYVAALPGTEVAYAGRAFLCRAMAQWIAAEGLSLAVCPAGELAVAQAVNFPAERIILHGNAKTPADLRAALRYGVDRIVGAALGARGAAVKRPVRTGDRGRTVLRGRGRARRRRHAACRCPAR